MEERKRKRERERGEAKREMCFSFLAHSESSPVGEARYEVGEKHGEKGWRGEGEGGREKGQEKDRQPFESPR